MPLPDADKRPRLQPVRYFMLLMALAYVGLGVFLIAAPPGMFTIAATNLRIVGGLFILYGLIRFVRIIRQNAHSRHE